MSVGRPRGRVVISKPRTFAVSANQELSPNGQPRSMLRWIAESSLSADLIISQSDFQLTQ